MLAVLGISTSVASAAPLVADNGDDVTDETTALLGKRALAFE